MLTSPNFGQILWPREGNCKWLNLSFELNMNLLRIFSLRGRITRSEFNISMIVVLLLSSAASTFYSYFNVSNNYLRMVLILLAYLIVIFQGYKRNQDLGKKGWKIFLGLDLQLLTKHGVEGENEYGPDPRLSDIS
jgi:uncharacterized membrane protein YhaH (DUF805 family)